MYVLSELSIDVLYRCEPRCLEQLLSIISHTQSVPPFIQGTYRCFITCIAFYLILIVK